MLTVEAIPVSCIDGDTFDVHRFLCLATVLRSSGEREHLLLSDGYRHVQIGVTAGSLLNGPVSFRYELSGFRHIEAKVLTLRRLLQLCRLGRFPRSLFPPERRARRWAMALQAYDGVKAGAGHREIAVVLFGETTVKEDWAGRSDYLRLRIQRLVRTANRFVNGGYREFLR